MSYARTAVTRMTLDMSRLDLQRSETVTLGDTNRRWEVTLINGGAPFRLPPNWTAALTGTKPDGTGLLNGCSVADGKIIYDFAAGAEIATCAGSYPVQFDIWDEVGDLVASPKVYVNVLEDTRPHAELASNGQYTLIGDLIGRVNQTDEDVDLLGKTTLAQGDDIAALKKKIITAGTITIPATEWTDMTPTSAYVSIQGGEALTKGGLLVVTPADKATKDECERAGVRIDIDLVTDQEPPSFDQIVFVRADEVPLIPLNFKYFALKTDSQQGAVVALVGVDAYGEGGGTASGVDENAVRAIITAMLGNVDNVRQYSADNPPPYPVYSVNSKTGAVVLTASDVGADAADTAKTLTDELSANIANDLKNYYNKSQTYNRTEIDNKLSAIPKFAVKVVTSLPTSGISETTVYLVKDTTEGGGMYTEYIWVNGAWEELGSQKLDLSGYVTDDELEEAVNAALTAAKESGEFDGRRGYAILRVSTSTTSSSGTGDTGVAIKYKIALSTVKSEAGVDEVLVGDTVLRASVYMYPVVKVDASYVYLGAYTSIKGNPGAAGDTPVRGTDYWTEEDKAEIIADVLAALPASEEVAL